jgi:hypothetical protein
MLPRQIDESSDINEKPLNVARLMNSAQLEIRQ